MKAQRGNGSAAVMASGILAACLFIAGAQDDSYFDDGGSAVVKPSIDDAGRVSSIQNAVLEGIQLSSEPGQEAHERIITCYFIFRDKPSSYFYEAKPKENKLVFEFNDTELGASPIPSMQEKPIQGFRVEPIKVDVNAEVKGLKPEWHDVIRVSFYMDAVPEISVKDEYSVISYTFTWSTDPSKQKAYMAVDAGQKSKTLMFSIGGGVGLAAAAGVVWYFLQGGKTPDKTPELSIDDLPRHPDPH